MMFLDISKKPGDPNAVVTEEQLLEENAKLKEENARLRKCNAAKMREAFEDILTDCAQSRRWERESTKEHYIDSIERFARAALAAPPRNCDVGTLTEQQKGFHDFCEKMQHTDKACCGGCPIVHLRMQGAIGNSCELAWAQMPYEAEGGAE